MKSKAKPTITPGVFIPTMQPTYASPEEVMAAHGATFADVKYDGYRAQVHKSGNMVKIFTRNGNEFNYACYPEIVRAVRKLPDCIIEAELVGEGSSHKEVFDNVNKRFRRPGISRKSMDEYAASGIIGEKPLSLVAFDTLHFEGKCLTGLPLAERRQYTERLYRKGLRLAETDEVRSVEMLEKLIDATFKDRQEGRVCKNPASLYIPGQENSVDWVKFKHSEPLDLVVVGFYNEKSYGLGLPFTSVLCATYNEVTGQYETIGKIGATRNGLAAEIQSVVKGRATHERPSNVAFSEKLDSPSCRKYVPESYIRPEKSAVLEVRAMNINFTDNWQTCGYDGEKAFSMRIGFARQVRYDKKPAQATTTQEIRKLYEIQERKK